MPPWGIDVKRAYRVISTLTDEGVAQVEDQDGTLVQVNITKALIAEALKLPRGSLSLLTRNTAEETNATFLFCWGLKTTPSRICYTRRWS